MQLGCYRVINLHFASVSDTGDDWKCKGEDVHGGPTPCMLGESPGGW